MYRYDTAHNRNNDYFKIKKKTDDMDDDGEDEAGLELVVECTGIIISVDRWLRTGTFILSLLLSSLYLIC
jgi:hypothetical protein